MSDTAVTIRMAEEADAAALLSIYAPYVEKTAKPHHIHPETVSISGSNPGWTHHRIRLCIPI